jgi:signal transduction protein with GAF and PtsI domain
VSEKSISEILGQGRANDDALGKVLDLILADFDCRVGTIHDWNAEKNLLRLRACRGMPEAILDKVRSIPIGKGMAGLAAQRREPVQVCNLQTDESGVAKPDAR